MFRFVISGQKKHHLVKYIDGRKKFVYTRVTNLRLEVNRIVIVLYGILLISVFTDMRKGKIPNWLIFLGSMIGILFSYCPINQFTQVIILFFILYPFFAAGVLGAGDVKCFCMIGLYLNQNQYIASILSSLFIAALFSIFILLKDLIFFKSNPLQQKHFIHLAGPIFLGVLISTKGTYL